MLRVASIAVLLSLVGCSGASASALLGRGEPSIGPEAPDEGGAGADSGVVAPADAGKSWPEAATPAADAGSASTDATADATGTSGTDAEANSEGGADAGVDARIDAATGPAPGVDAGVWPGDSSGPCVQITTGTPPGLVTSASATFPRGQAALDLNVVVVSWGDATTTVTQVTDTAGNAYALALGPTQIVGVSQSIYYASGIAGAERNTVLVDFALPVSRADVRAVEYSGFDPMAPLDAVAENSGNGSSATSGTATTAWPSELVVGAGSTTGLFAAAGTSFTLRAITSDGNLLEDRQVPAAGSYAAGAALPYSVNWVMQVATFH
jgi:hypothetical protein